MRRRGAAGCWWCFGRRRVGKTRLLRQWLQARDGLYSQAIEAQRDMQIQQVFADLRPQLETQLVPKTWPELFEILALQKKRWVLCLDEFPYLTAVDASLPSQLQKWLDHSLPRGLPADPRRLEHAHDERPVPAPRRAALRPRAKTPARSADGLRRVLRRLRTYSRRPRIRSRNSPVSAASRSIGSSSKPDRMWWRWWNRSTSISPPTWSRSRSGFCATRASSG